MLGPAFGFRIGMGKLSDDNGVHYSPINIGRGGPYEPFYTTPSGDAVDRVLLIASALVYMYPHHLAWAIILLLSGGLTALTSTLYERHREGPVDMKTIDPNLSVTEIKAYRTAHPELSLTKAMEELSKSIAKLQ